MSKEGHSYKNKCGRMSHVATLTINPKTKQPEKDLLRTVDNRSP